MLRQSKTKSNIYNLQLFAQRSIGLSWLIWLWKCALPNFGECPRTVCTKKHPDSTTPISDPWHHSQHNTYYPLLLAWRSKWPDTFPGVWLASRSFLLDLPSLLSLFLCYCCCIYLIMISSWRWMKFLSLNCSNFKLIGSSMIFKTAFSLGLLRISIFSLHVSNKLRYFYSKFIFLIMIYWVFSVSYSFSNWYFTLITYNEFRSFSNNCLFYEILLYNWLIESNISLK